LHTTLGVFADGFSLFVSLLIPIRESLTIIVNLGPLIGGMAVMLAISSSFPFAHLYEQGRNTIWAPALVHGTIDTVIPILAAGRMAGSGQQAALIWMGISMVLPSLADRSGNKHAPTVRPGAAICSQNLSITSFTSWP